jgi:hypothetical protein
MATRRESETHDKSNPESEASDWITSAIKNAQQANDLVPETVFVQLEALLRGKFGQRAIPAKELAAIAMELIDGIAPLPPKREKQQ